MSFLDNLNIGKMYTGSSNSSSQLSVKAQEKTQAEQEVQQYSEQETQVESQKSDIQNRLTETSNSLMTAQNNLSTAQGQVSAAQSQVSAAQAQVSTAQSNQAAANSHLASANANLAAAQAIPVETKTNEDGSVTTDSSARDAAIAAALAEVAQAEAEVNQAEAEFNNAEQQLQSAQDQLQTAQEAVNSAQEAVNSAQQEAQAIQQEIQDIEAQVQEIQSGKQEAENNLSQIEQEYAELEAQVQEEEEEAKAEEEEEAKAEEEEEAKAEEEEKAKKEEQESKETDNLNSNLADNNANNDKNKEAEEIKLDSLKDELDDIFTKIDLNQDSINDVKDDIEETKDNLKDIEDDLTDAKLLFGFDTSKENEELNNAKNEVDSKEKANDSLIKSVINGVKNIFQKDNTKSESLNSTDTTSKELNDEIKEDEKSKVYQLLRQNGFSDECLKELIMEKLSSKTLSESGFDNYTFEENLKANNIKNEDLDFEAISILNKMDEDVLEKFYDLSEIEFNDFITREGAYKYIDYDDLKNNIEMINNLPEEDQKTMLNSLDKDNYKTLIYSEIDTQEAEKRIKSLSTEVKNKLSETKNLFSAVTKTGSFSKTDSETLNYNLEVLESLKDIKTENSTLLDKLNNVDFLSNNNLDKKAIESILKDAKKTEIEVNGQKYKEIEIIANSPELLNAMLTSNTIGTDKDSANKAVKYIAEEIAKGNTFNNALSMNYIIGFSKDFKNNLGELKNRVEHYLSYDIDTLNNSSDGIYNLINKDPKSEEAKDIDKLLDLIASGYVSEDTIISIPKNGSFTEPFIDDVRKLHDAVLNNKNPKDVFVPTLSSTQDGVSSLKIGEVFEVAGHDNIYIVSDDGTAHELHMDKNTYYKLFPPVERYGMNQAKIGNCWEVSAEKALMNDPRERENIYKVFYQDGNDIKIKFPNSKYEEITFKNGELPVSETTQEYYYSLGGSQGIKILEYADAKEMQSERIDEFVNHINELINNAKTENEIKNLTNILSDFTYQMENNKDNLYVRDNKYEVIDGSIKDAITKQREGGRSFYLWNKLGYETSTIDIDENIKEKLEDPKFYDNYVVNWSTESVNNDEIALNKDLGIYYSHEYQLKPVINDNGTVTSVNIINPWGNVATTLTIDEAIEYGDSLDLAKR